MMGDWKSTKNDKAKFAQGAFKELHRFVVVVLVLFLACGN